MQYNILIYTMAAGITLSSLSGCGGGEVNAGQDTNIVTEAETAAETTSESTETTAETATEVEETETGLAIESILVWGQVLRTDAEFNRIVIDNQSNNSVKGEIVLNIAEENTRVLDAVDGLPVSLTDISEGEIIYAYLGPAMTLSLPPITTPSMVICKIPADFRVPEYVKVSEMEKQEDGSYLLTGTNKTEYSVPADCVILPFLTRNMVRLEHVAEGNYCLVWMGNEAQVSKIVLFAD